MNKKPLGRKSYGSIAHLPNSRLGSGDHCITEGQARIATEKARDKHDVVIVQEKLDGSNVGVAMIDGEIVAITRAGYLADTSPYKMHHDFKVWVFANSNRFSSVLHEGERICGEWLTEAHGTKYDLPHEPFVAFDIIDSNQERMCFVDFVKRINHKFVIPTTIRIGSPLSVEDALSQLGEFGNHGALEPIEGAMWRVERKGKVDFLCKFVKHEKEDGKYLGCEPVLNRWAS